MTLITLVTGPTAAARESAIAAAISSAADTAVILEGLPSGGSPLNALAAPAEDLHLARITPGCICCAGNLSMRVTLNRILRRKPACLYISLATASHLPQIHAFLSQKPYDALVKLTEEIRA